MQSKMLPTYVYWDISRVLHTVIFPCIDRSYPDQRLIILLVLLYIVSKFLFRSFSLLSMSIPNIVNSLSQLSLRSWQMFSPSKTPTGITFVFEMLHFRPDISQNRCDISTVFLKKISDLSMKKVQSSAKPEALSSNSMNRISTIKRENIW